MEVESTEGMYPLRGRFERVLTETKVFEVQWFEQVPDFLVMVLCEPDGQAWDKFEVISVEGVKWLEEAMS